MSTSTEISEERRAFIDGLRELADYLETANIDVQQIAQYGNCITLDVFTWEDGEFREQSQLLGGTRKKILNGSFAITRRYFGPHRIDININREKVCEKVQVGTRVVPAQEAVEEHEEPVYEWQCEGFTVAK